MVDGRLRARPDRHAWRACRVNDALMTGDRSERGRAVLMEAVRAYRGALGSRLVAAYGLGSLAHGGFSPQVSDVDLCLVLGRPTGPRR